MPGEALNDSASYRLPIHWQEWWDQDDGAAARFSAGSLNAREFLYSEDVRFSAAPDDSSLWLFFERNRTQNHWTSGARNELALTLPAANSPLPALSILMDSDAVKKNADLGLAIGRRRSGIDYSEIFLWSVDHYYNTKETSLARWSRKPLAAGWRMATPLTANVTGPGIQRAWFQIQTPGRHEQPGESGNGELVCEIAEKSAQANGYLAKNLMWDVVSIQRDKTLTSPLVNKKTVRTTTSVGATWTGTSISNAVARDVAHHARLQLVADDLKRETGSSSARRRELIATLTRTWKPDAPFSWFSGIVASRGDQQTEDGTVRENLSIEQAKLQTGLEYKIGWNTAPKTPRGSFRTLANWDLDHLVRDVPYKKHAFRPWDGGLLQFSFHQ